MDRNRERRTGTERRHRPELYLPWQEPARQSGWDGTERRSGERRTTVDRPPSPRPPHDDLERYSDDWARARGALTFNDWLDRSARQAPLGLPGVGSAA